MSKPHRLILASLNPDLPPLIQIPRIKATYPWNLGRSAKEALIFFYSWSTLYILLILHFLFWYGTFLPNASLTIIYSWNFRCSAKGAVILLHSWSTLYIAFSKCIVSYFYLFNFDLPLFTEVGFAKLIYFGNSGCSTK